MSLSIKAFIDELISITPANFAVNPYNSKVRMPTIGSRGMPGTGEASTDVMQALIHNAIEFGEIYKDPKASEGDVRRLAEDIEGNLMIQTTLSVLTEEKANRLIDELQALVSQKYS